MSIRWVPECKFCGKRDMVKICSTRNDKKPNEPPEDVIISFSIHKATI